MKNEMNNSQLTLTQLFGAVMRQKFRGLLTFILVFGLVMGLFLIWPKSYGSEGKLHVQMSRIETNLSPMVGTNGQSMGFSIQDTRETEIKSVEEVLKSRAVMEAVVRKVGAKKIIGNSIAAWLPSLSVPSFLKGSSSNDDMSPEEYKKLKTIEKAVTLLEESITVHNMKKTSVISVYVKANSPRLA